MAPGLVIFDLDGVLVSSRDMHYQTLNQALISNGFSPIPYNVHLSTYDGLPTSRKLELLNIPEHQRRAVWQAKQQATLENIRNILPDRELQAMFDELESLGWGLAVVSNATANTTHAILERLGVHVGVMVSPDMGFAPKPSPEMYWHCMSVCGTTALNTVIVEDSHIGRRAALASGATLLPVESREDLSVVKILEALGPEANIPWIQQDLNVLIPMAGHGSRFAEAGYTFPKPLVEVRGKPMIQVVVENLNISGQYIFIVQQEHNEKYALPYLLNMIAPGCRIITVDQVTEGAACTALLARELINTGQPLLIANSDQYMDWDVNECMYAFSHPGIDGGILTFNASHPKWSYVQLDGRGFVRQVEEKKVISNLATTGVYYWREGQDFVRYAERMIRNNTRTNGEFYIAPVFNEAIADQKLIRTKQVRAMHGLGTPEDLREFLETH